MVAIILILNLIVLTLFQINKVTSLSNPTEVEVEGSHVYVRFTPYLDYSERTEEGYAIVIISNSTARPVNFYLLWDSSLPSRRFSKPYWKDGGSLLKFSILKPILEESHGSVKFGYGSFTTKRLAGLGWSMTMYFYPSLIFLREILTWSLHNSQQMDHDRY